jgi:hypothetical protein
MIASKSKGRSHRKGMVKVSWLAAVVFVSAILAVRAPACYEQTVRDAAFGYPRDVHILAVVAEEGDPAGDEIYQGLARWIDTSGSKLNLEIRLVEPNDPDVDWQELGLPSAPPSWPVVVFTGGRSRSVGRPNFLVDHWEPGPGTAALEVLRSSPAREQIAREVPRRLAALLYVPGDGREGGAAEAVIDSIVDTWSNKNPGGLSVVRVERSDERERLLLKFMGSGRTSSDMVAVVFGRGKMTAPLRGGEITGEQLNRQLELLVGDCTCIQSPYTLGVDIPMQWDEICDSAVVALGGSTQTAVARGGGRIVAATVWTLGGLVLLVGLTSVWIVRKRTL